MSEFNAHEASIRRYSNDSIDTEYHETQAQKARAEVGANVYRALTNWFLSIDATNASDGASVGA